MPIAILAPLIAQYGLPLAQQIFALWQAKADVTPEQFGELVKLASYRSSDALAAAGIRIDDTGKVVPA
jgi:hypothetical protein